jgi:4-amino-4-deoxy-L-arabinose transferase-like glycosyltransferase
LEINPNEPLRMLKSRQSLILLSLLLLALGLRVGAAIVIDRHVRNEGRQFLIEGDANGYWELAQKISSGQEYSIYTPPRRALRTPGFPLLLAASITTFGKSILAASLVMAVVGTGCCLLTWLLARRVATVSVANVALLIVAISPLQIGSNVQILSETLFSFGVLACLFPLTKLVRTPEALTPVDSFTAGLLIGLTTLVRPGWILWPWLSSLLILVWSHQAWRRRILYVTLIFAGCYLALLPWAWRNHNVTGHWIFTSLWSGPSLYDGLHPGATGASDMTFVDTENVFSRMSEYDTNDHYKQRAFEFAVDNPLRTMQLAILKAGRYLSPTLNAAGFSGGPASLVSLAWYASFWALIIVGIASLRKEPALIALLVGPFLQFLVVHMVFVGSIRYRLPVEFPLSIIAAHGWGVMMARIGVRRA